MAILPTARQLVRSSVHLSVRCCSLNLTSRSLSSAADKYIVRSKHGLEPSTSTNFADHVLRGAHGREKQIALVCSEAGSSLQYGALVDASSRWGGFLIKRGLGRGSVIAVLAPNLIDYASVVLGTIRIGGVFTGINPAYTAQEIAFQLEDSGASMLVVYGPLEAVARQALAIAKKDIPVIGIGPSGSTGLPNVADIVQDTTINFTEPAEVTGGERMALLYSSGTTGKPKGVSIHHSAGIFNLDMLVHPKYYVGNLSRVETPTYMFFLPFFHLSGFLPSFSKVMMKGAKLVVFPKFRPETFVDSMHEHKVNTFHVVPSVLNFLLAHPKFTRENFEFVDGLMCGGAPVPASAAAKVCDRISKNGEILQVFGMTEVLVTHVDPLGGTRLGFTGQILPGVEGKVVDTVTGEDLLPTQTGELCMRGPTIMKEYINNPKATADTIDKDGWVHSGDVGHYDEDGYVKVVDRIKELIKVNALQVSPSELEDVILQLPEVAEVSVIGVPDDKTGELPRAYIVAKKDFDINKVVEHVAQNCAKHKHLKGGVSIVAELPKNATGKVMRKELVKLAAAGK